MANPKEANFRIVRYNGEYRVEVLDKPINWWYIVAAHVKTLQEAVMLCGKYEDNFFMRMPNGNELNSAWDKERAKLKEKGLTENKEQFASNAFFDGFGYGFGVGLGNNKKTRE